MVELPYGRVPYRLDLGGRHATVVEPAPRPGPPALEPMLHRALDAPTAIPPVERLASSGARITLVVSDATRLEPRRAFIDALHQRLPDRRWTLAIATGTHGPADLAALDLPEDFVRDAVLVNHDGHRDEDLVTIGTTRRGTPVRLHGCVLDADLVIATGCIRPHYFAGFGAGIKAIFPGLGQAAAIRLNHAFKTLPGARAGVVDGNPCRDDLEEAVALVQTPIFLLNAVAAPDGRFHAVVAGHPRDAFRDGVVLAREWFTVRAPCAPVVIASDAPPVSSSLYQAAKIAAAVAPLVESGGALVVVAECRDGTGPLHTVNEAIFRIGVLPRLATDVTLYLVSGLDADQVARTLLQYAPSVASVLEQHDGPVVVVPRASQLLYEATS